MSAERRKFTKGNPVKRISEEAGFYGELRGTEYHKVMPMPRTWVSDCRQIAPPWVAAAIDALPAFMGGISNEWRSRFADWTHEIEQLAASKQAPNEVYERNEQFWLALHKLAMQLGSKDQIVTPHEVLVWAVKDTVRERVEDVQDAAEAVYDTGRSAVNAVQNAAGAIPTIAKALAVGAVGLGVYAVARRK